MGGCLRKGTTVIIVDAKGQALPDKPSEPSVTLPPAKEGESVSTSTVSVSDAPGSANITRRIRLFESNGADRVKIVAEGADDFEAALSQFKKTAGPNMTITAIELVRNPPRIAAFAGKASVGSKTGVVFHGTPSANVEPIVRDGFIASAGGSYGPGVYITPQAATANGYSQKAGPGEGGISKMLACWAHLLPAENHDNSILCAADSLRVLPFAIIEYRIITS